MMNEDIKNLLQALSWDNPIDIQLKAMHTIAEDEAFDPALLLPYPFSVDEDAFDQELFLQDCQLGQRYRNVAIILTKWGSPRIDAIIPGLFRWLQDLNWPGALEILVLLYGQTPLLLLTQPHLRMKFPTQ